MISAVLFAVSACFAQDEQITENDSAAVIRTIEENSVPVVKTGAASHTTVIWTFPSGAKLTIPCVINVTEWESGDSTAVAPLAFDIMSDGKPTYTEASE